MKPFTAASNPKCLEGIRGDTLDDDIGSGFLNLGRVLINRDVRSNHHARGEASILRSGSALASG